MLHAAATEQVLHGRYLCAMESAVKMRVRLSRFCARALVLIFALLSSINVLADGWTPTDAGLVVDLKPGDKFLLSVWIDVNNNGTEEAGEEFFVCDYPGYSGGRFNYGQTSEIHNPSKNYMKLVPQEANATAPSSASIWTVDTALTRVFGNNNYALGGIAYTMKSSIGNTLFATDGWKLMGGLSNNASDNNLCDVVFAVPTVQARTNMDPDGTLNASHTAEGRNRGTGDKTWAFDGKTGTGFLGMTYREVYWYEIARNNKPRAYTNAAMVAFNLTNGTIKVRNVNISKGRNYWIYNQNKDGSNYNAVQRMIFRLYILQEHPFETCPNTYFFAHEKQDYVAYRWGDPEADWPKGKMTDYTDFRKIYTTDHHHCMERVNDKYYQTEELVTMFDDDSTYYYIGKYNEYYSRAKKKSLAPPVGLDSSFSQFRPIRQMRVRPLANAVQTFYPSPGAVGRVVIDTTKAAENLGASFEPVGYFLRTQRGKNIQLFPNADGTEWTTEEMWTITSDSTELTFKTMLYTVPSYSATDTGAVIAGWSQAVSATSLLTTAGTSAVGQSGWLRMYPSNEGTNGGLVMVTVDADKYIRYHNNGHFGVDIPDQHPMLGITTLTVQDARLLEGYNFTGWNTAADGSGKAYAVGDKVRFDSLYTAASTYVLDLYAQATYTGDINVAISFLKNDGKRYFMTLSGEAPRYAKTRHFDDWTRTWQGMGDQTNSDPNYLNTFKLIGNPTCVECATGEYVLDPHRVTMHGGEDSLVFWDGYQPQPLEYIGLYYEPGINLVLSNTNWAGLFKSSAGWPTPATPCVNSTQLYSTHYLGGDYPTTIERRERNLPPNIKYNATDDQFDGVNETGTDFMISGVGVVDAHYVILPDTSDAETPWTDAITFGYHVNHQTTEDVWSKLIGKHLLAQMKVGNEIIYFHPSKDTIIDASELRLSSNYRLTHSFSYIRDKRIETLSNPIANADKPTMATTDNAFHCTVTSGENSPILGKVGGSYIDIVDTLRVTLRPANTSRIKDYYGRWKTGAEGVHVRPDGSRYRDILITTKTYHCADTVTSLRLVPAKEIYSFGSVNGLYEDLSFTVQKATTHKLLDKDGNPVHEEIISTEDMTEQLLDLTSGTTLTLKESDIFSLGTPTRTGVRLTTLHENTTSPNWDTLTVNTTVTVSGVDTVLTVKVPLLQVSTIGTELVWSVEYSGSRYFIFATSTGLRYKRFSMTDNRLVNAQQELIIGAGNADNSDEQYITPWSWTDINANAHTLILKTKYGVDRYFSISAGNTPGVDADSIHSSILTFIFDTTYTNPNGNYEELVYLRYLNDKWLKFDGTKLVVVGNKNDASLFSWGYMLPEYYLLNNGTYPSKEYEEFTYNSTRVGSVQTRYQAYLDHSMLLNNQFVRVAKVNEADIADLIDGNQQWKTEYTVSRIPDGRAGVPSSGFSISTNPTTLTTTITPSGASPMNVQYDGKYVNIVDTLDFRISLQTKAPTYRFSAWDGVSSLDDAHLKIPLIRRTYHTVSFDSLMCAVENDDYNFAFPSSLREGVSADSLHTFTLRTKRYIGRNVFNVYDEKAASYRDQVVDSTHAMDLSNISMSEIRLIDEYGNDPTWCEIKSKTKNTITIKCLSNGIRSPRVAYIYLAYMVIVDGQMRFVNYRLSVSQASLFYYANNQQLIHTAGASGDPKMEDGRQYAHENKRILYYYNPKPYNVHDQKVELPVRERGFYGWWRWYREGKDQNGVDVSDTDIPDSVWITPPRNTGKYDFPYRIIGDSVWKDSTNHALGKKLATMGRYTVFHYPSKAYGTKYDPPSKSPMVAPPYNETTVTYVVDLSNYYDNLPLSMSSINQVDINVLDTMKNIIEPTLSLREVFELHPWTEMAARLDTFKTLIPNNEKYPSDKYMEDHVVMAPTGRSLLLSTEQRYDTLNLQPIVEKDGTIPGHSESLLGYYMRDDNWNKTDGAWTFATPEARKACQDTMIWCGGWDATCSWYTYDPSTQQYSTCEHSTTSDDYLRVPSKGGISAGHEFDTVYYCLRSRSKKTENPADPNSTEDGDYWFNICRYKVIYHNPSKYGPWPETLKNGKMEAIITNDKIENDYEVLERLNFDYNKPGHDYTVYPHPLPWEDVSYGYSYPLSSSALPNRYHNETDFPGPGEYALINKIKYSSWWHTIEQHGGDTAGYMLYCDGMSAAGQVATLSLHTNLCEGQKLYFTGYVANASNQTGSDRAHPNFTFSVQGSKNGKDWEDISSFMTGDIEPVKKNPSWYQIFFPIDHEQAYEHFRVRIFNMSSKFNGNDFVIDDMCIFATKPPLIAYQAQTKCVESNENDSIIHVVLRVDYQGFIDENFNNADVYYTVEQKKPSDGKITFVPMIDGYLNERHNVAEVDTVFGYIPMPAHHYEPSSESDSIFINLNKLAERFEESYEAHEAWEKAGRSGEEPKLFRQGYIYENLDGDIRPVLYVVHKAKMSADNQYKVRMSLGEHGLMSSQCAMTSVLNVTNRMMLMLDGVEQEMNQVEDICGNVTYDLSMRVRGTLIQDSVAPIDLTGSCVNDWLLYGDTARESSRQRYGYYYSDIVKVVKDILRYEPASGESNANQFARTLGAVNRNVMNNILGKYTGSGRYLETEDEPYVVLSNLVNNGFLQLYQTDLMAALVPGDSLKYVVFPILGTGTADLQNKNMEVCPTPLVIVLKSKPNVLGSPLILGGLHRDSTQLSNPITVLADATLTSTGVLIPVDFIRTLIGVHSVELTSTDDPNFREGVHHLEMTPDRSWPATEGYYQNGDTILLVPSSSNNYEMQPGYNYTYRIQMVSWTENPIGDDGCPIGTVSFTISYVPDYLRWNPRNGESNQWNNADNWVGITPQNKPIHEEARFVPLPSTKVVIPALPDSLPYPVLPSTITSKDSVQQVGFAYNICDAIRFLPGAAIGNQQLLTYDNAIVDMSLPQQKWALRAAPVTGMLSGDLFLSNADLLANSNPWQVGEFDAAGRSYKTTGGIASFWLSLYSREAIRKGNNDQVKDSTMSAAADWSSVTNGMTLPLPQTQGFAVYMRTKSGKAADIRLPKNDDKYYYYTKSGDKQDDNFEDNLRYKRDSIALAGGASKAGKLAYNPVGNRQTITLTNGKDDEGNSVETPSIVFGNPTVGYIDIWGFIADNSDVLDEEILYLDAEGSKHQVVKETANATENKLSTLERYLPPTQAIMIKLNSNASSVTLKLDTNRIVTKPVKEVEPTPTPAPKRMVAARNKGIMTIIAINPVSPRCVSRLMLGQGYHNAIQKGEDAVLTTFNIDNFSMTDNPTTPFNIYAIEDGYGMSIDLREEIDLVPLSFYMSDLPYEPTTQLWFTGVNAIDGQLFLYDALTDTEKPILDGICWEIETPESNHERRYYIRRVATPEEKPDDPITTSVGYQDAAPQYNEQAVKIIYNGHVLILRNGHVYTMFGQKIR